MFKKSFGKTTSVIWTVGIGIVIIPLCYAAWFLNRETISLQSTQVDGVVIQDTIPVIENTPSTTPEIKKDAPAVVQNMEPKQKGIIQYEKDTSQILKTIVLPEVDGYESETIYWSDIGTITSGKFKDKKLGFVFGASTYFNTGTMDDSPYAYLIIDSVGNLVAWDKNFIHADETCSDWGGGTCPYKVFFNTFNVMNLPEESLDFIPPELSSDRYITGDDHRSKFSNFRIISNLDVSGMRSFKGETESGFKIWKSADYGTIPVSSQTDYVMELPFGKMMRIPPEPDFFLEYNPLPQLTWTQGTKEIASYNYGQYAYGWDDCYDGISETEFNAGLIVTGTTVKGDSLYEIDAQKFPKVYACLHEKTKRYVYNERTEQGKYVDTIAYKDFVSTHPMFFWRHPIVGLMGFVRSDVVPAAEKAKPVVYLYPEQDERIRVSVAPIGGLTITDPEYGRGWIVDATPEGKLTNVADGKQYPYLFWEGGREGVVQTPKEGFVIAKEDMESTLREKLLQLGLNTQEQSDFLEFWVPKLSHAPYYFITFISKSEIDRVAPMNISPTPDTVIRVLMDYKPLEKPIDVEPLEIRKTERTGFTVIEWGGIVRD